MASPTDLAPADMDLACDARIHNHTVAADWLRRRWPRVALGLILALAALCDFFELQRVGYGNLYYASAIRSMLESWHNFFFVSFDPGGFVSIDKPPLGFWIQAASAKIFGFSGFSILLPEALAGVASVGVLYLVVRRLFGVVPGLLAALALALMPISVVTNRNNTIDSLLVLAVLLAAYAITRATERGSLRWLLLSAVFVGLGFNIKTLEAYLVVPAFAAMYLLGAPRRWRVRAAHLALAGLVMLVLSLSWIVAVDLTPASQRPYVGSSTTNSELALALGYNGLGRLTGALGLFRGGTASSTSTSIGGVLSAIGSNASAGGVGGVSENGAKGIFRLLNAQLGGQVSWLLVLGLVGLLAGGWTLFSRGVATSIVDRWKSRRDVFEGARESWHLTPQQSAWVLWAGWTLVMAAFFSVAGFFHTYYLSMLAPGAAALAGIGAVLLWRDYRDYQASGWRSWLLPVALVLAAISQIVILADYPQWSHWMVPLLAIGSVVAAGLLVWLRLRSPREVARQFRLGVLALALGLTALFVGPATWVGYSLASGANSTLPKAGPTATVQTTSGLTGGAPGGAFGPRAGGGFPGGGPSGLGANGEFGTPPAGGFGGAGRGATGSVPTGGPAGMNDTTVNAGLLAYLEAHQGTATYLFATLDSHTAAPYILATGKPVMALGGFSGSDQILTLSQLQTLIRSGKVRYFLLSGSGQGGPGGGGNSTLTQWVTANCSAVSSSAYGGSTSGGAFGAGQLYDCASATTSSVANG